jgi:molybdopterin converting factor small subunit
MRSIVDGYVAQGLISMTVQLRFFAGLVPLIGEKSIEMTLPVGATVATLQARLAERYPVLEGFMSTYVCAVDEEMREGGYVLRDGDLVDFIPPIAGG